MGFLGLFGRKAGNKARGGEAAPARAQADRPSLAGFAGIRMEVTAASDGRLLFIGELQNIEDDEAELHVLSSDAQAILPPGTVDVRFRGYSRKGSQAVCLDGAITAAEPGMWLVENLSLRRAGNDRSFFRLDTTGVEASVSHAASNLEEPCRLVNFSVGGVCLAMRNPRRVYRLSDQLKLQAQLLPDREPLVIFCRVLRVTHREGGRVEYGCCFLDQSEADQEKLTQLIFELQRQKRSMS